MISNLVNFFVAMCKPNPKLASILEGYLPSLEKALEGYCKDAHDWNGNGKYVLYVDGLPLPTNTDDEEDLVAFLRQVLKRNYAETPAPRLPRGGEEVHYAFFSPQSFIKYQRTKIPKDFGIFEASRDVVLPENPQEYHLLIYQACVGSDTEHGITASVYQNYYLRMTPEHRATVVPGTENEVVEKLVENVHLPNCFAKLKLKLTEELLKVLAR